MHNFPSNHTRSRQPALLQSMAISITTAGKTWSWEISSYLSAGDGIYQAPITLPASIGAIGDFNHDGKLDFVSYVPASTSVVVFLGVCCAVDWITWKFTGAKHCLRNKNARERARFGGSRLSVHALGPLMDK